MPIRSLLARPLIAFINPSPHWILQHELAVRLLKSTANTKMSDAFVPPSNELIPPGPNKQATDRNIADEHERSNVSKGILSACVVTCAGNFDLETTLSIGMVEAANTYRSPRIKSSIH